MWGRPIADLHGKIELPELEQLLHEITDTVTARELEQQDSNGDWHSIRIRPRKALDSRIDGASSTSIGITELR